MSGDATVVGGLALMVLAMIFNSWIFVIAAVIWFLKGVNDQ